jgi:hypothetical protein
MAINVIASKTSNPKQEIKDISGFIETSKSAPIELFRFSKEHYSSFSIEVSVRAKNTASITGLFGHFSSNSVEHGIKFSSTPTPSVEIHCEETETECIVYISAKGRGKRICKYAGKLY